MHGEDEIVQRKRWNDERREQLLRQGEKDEEKYVALRLDERKGEWAGEHNSMKVYARLY